MEQRKLFCQIRLHAEKALPVGKSWGWLLGLFVNYNYQTSTGLALNLDNIGIPKEKNNRVDILGLIFCTYVCIR